MIVGGHFELQIADKPLPIATWLLLTAYKNLPTPYPTVPLPSPYDVPFRHNTKRDRRQTTDGRHNVPLAQRSTLTKKVVDGGRRQQTSVWAEVVLKLVGVFKAASADGTRERGGGVGWWRCLGVSSSDVTVVCRVRRERLAAMLALQARTDAQTIQYNVLLLQSQTNRCNCDIYKYNSIADRQLLYAGQYCVYTCRTDFTDTRTVLRLFFCFSFFSSFQLASFPSV